MKLWATLRDAVIGWRLLLGRAPGWRERFSLTRPGMVTALGLFVIVALLAVSVASVEYGAPTLPALIAGLAVLMIPVAAVLLALWVTRKAVGGLNSSVDVLVPAIFLLIAFVPLEGIIAALIGGPAIMLSWLALGFGYFRLARTATAWSRGVSASFAILAVLMLVAMRIALYILSNPPASPI